MLDPVRLDPYTRQAWAGDRLLDLTLTQWRLLAALVAQPGTAITWDRLAAAISTRRPFSTNAVRVALCAVRRQLGDPAYVRTIPTVGLCFTRGLAADIYVGREAGDVAA